MGLSPKANGGVALHFLAAGDACAGEIGAHLGARVLQRAGDAADFVVIGGAAGLQAHIAGAFGGEGHIRIGGAEGRLRSGGGGHDEGGQPQFGRQHPGVGGPCAAIGEEGEIAGIIAALHAHAAQEIGHARIENLADAPGGFDGAEAQWPRHLLVNRAPRRLHIERHPPADEIAGVEHAQHEVCVRGGGLHAAPSIAGGTGIGAGALRTHLQAAAHHPRDAAPACADGIDVDGMHADIGARHGYVGAHDGLTLDDHAHIETGAADVGGQNIAKADLRAHGLRAHDASGGA